jgi:hypothetical protein
VHVYDALSRVVEPSEQLPKLYMSGCNGPVSLSKFER